ncbi:MAG TPA: putative transporter, partial [Saprospiraceae bacterium]|nr:putative transporter [Saprospiraceae bacterium]
TNCVIFAPKISKMFDWFKNLFYPTISPDITQSLVALLITIGLGVFIGKMRLKRVSLGVSAVMFVGIFMGHFGYTVNENISGFTRDLGLILFVYAIGIQVGPSFFSSFKREGIRFNLLSTMTVLFGGLITFVLYKIFHLEIENAVGLMSGAVTNTPGLGAAKASLQEIQSQFPERTFADPAIAYAITYPMGVLSVIIMIILTKSVLKINLKDEHSIINIEKEKEEIRVVRKKIRVSNPSVIGKSIESLLVENDLNDIIISRIKHTTSTEVFTPSLNTKLRERDVLMVVGQENALDRFTNLVGKESEDQEIESENDIVTRTIYVTRKSATHKKLSDLDLLNKFGLRVTRVYRSGMELLAVPSLELFYGDRIRVVGTKNDIAEVEKVIGNSQKRLLEPDFLSLFGGLVIGIMIGSIPIFIPSLPVPVKLGFAAGPLLAALLISRYGKLGIIHSYINNGAIFFMKDLGISLFFASVGLHAGTHFYENFVAYNGWLWVVYGLVISVIPLIMMVIVGRFFMKINYFQLVGLMSGTYTDPAALAFSNGYLDSDIPTQAYATVYPLVTIFRIFVAQMLILLCI